MADSLHHFHYNLPKRFNRFDRIQAAVDQGLKDPNVIAKITGYKLSSVIDTLCVLKQFGGDPVAAAKARAASSKKCREGKLLEDVLS